MTNTQIDEIALILLQRMDEVGDCRIFPVEVRNAELERLKGLYRAMLTLSAKE